jgi:hypothetical protein
MLVPHQESTVGDGPQPHFLNWVEDQNLSEEYEMDGPWKVGAVMPCITFTLDKLTCEPLGECVELGQCEELAIEHILDDPKAYDIDHAYSLMMQMQQIAIETRRGPGNHILIGMGTELPRAADDVFEKRLTILRTPLLAIDEGILWYAGSTIYDAPFASVKIDDGYAVYEHPRILRYYRRLRFV